MLFFTFRHLRTPKRSWKSFHGVLGSPWNVLGTLFCARHRPTCFEMAGVSKCSTPDIASAYRKKWETIPLPHLELPMPQSVQPPIPSPPWNLLFCNWPIEELACRSVQSCNNEAEWWCNGQICLPSVSHILSDSQLCQWMSFVHSVNRRPSVVTLCERMTVSVSRRSIDLCMYTEDRRSHQFESSFGILVHMSTLYGYTIGCGHRPWI